MCYSIIVYPYRSLPSAPSIRWWRPSPGITRILTRIHL